MGGGAQDQELNIIVCNKPRELGSVWTRKEETSSPQSEGPPTPSKGSKNRWPKWWIHMATYTALILIGQSISVLLGRLYYNKGGESMWVATLMQVVGFPVLLPLYYILPSEKLQTYNNQESNEISPLKAASVYIFLGLFVTAGCLLYSIGLQYLPVSTFSLICASQLAFNALFAFFINSQKFTPNIVNSVVLLTISSTLLVFNSDSSKSFKQVSRAKYALGLVCAIASSAGYGLLLSLTQFVFERVLKRECFRAILDLIVYQSLVASCAAVVGLFASGDWSKLTAEMDRFKLGKFSYMMTLAWTALGWQLYNIGLVGLLVKVSSLFSNVIATLGLPIVPVLAVVFFHDNMDGIKVIAMLLAIWGFVSYAYQQYLHHYNSTQTEATLVSEDKN